MAKITAASYGDVHETNKTPEAPGIVGPISTDVWYSVRGRPHNGCCGGQGRQASATDGKGGGATLKAIHSSVFSPPLATNSPGAKAPFWKRTSKKGKGNGTHGKRSWGTCWTVSTEQSNSQPIGRTTSSRKSAPLCAKRGSNSNAFGPLLDAYNTQHGSYRLLEAFSRRCIMRSRDCWRPLVSADTGKSGMPSSTSPRMSSTIWQADQRTSRNLYNSCSTTQGTAMPVHSEPAAFGLVRTWLYHQLLANPMAQQHHE